MPAPSTALHPQIQRVINAIVEARGAASTGQPECTDRWGGKPTAAAGAAEAADGCSSSSRNWPFEARKRQLAPMVGTSNVGPETRFILVGAAVVVEIGRSLDPNIEACARHQINDM